jgi:hypothetical protein
VFYRQDTRWPFISSEGFFSRRFVRVRRPSISWGPGSSETGSVAEDHSPKLIPQAFRCFGVTLVTKTFCQVEKLMLFTILHFEAVFYEFQQHAIGAEPSAFLPCSALAQPTRSASSRSGGPFFPRFSLHQYAPKWCTRLIHSSRKISSGLRPRTGKQAAHPAAVASTAATTTAAPVESASK